MMLWLFFTIFGLVLFLPATIIFLLLIRFKKTIKVLFKQNGSLTSCVINDDILRAGKITEIKGKKIKPIYVSKDEIYQGCFRRWIIKGELDSTIHRELTDKEIEEHLNNEDLLKLYLAGKFKDTLMIFLTIIIIAIILSGVINGYLTASHTCVISQDNSTRDFIKQSVILAIKG